MQIALIAFLWVILGPSWLVAEEAEAAQAPPVVEAPVVEAADAAITIEEGGEAYTIVEGDAKARKQDDPQIAALEEQLRPHVQRFVQTELHFLRAVCQPTTQEFRNVKKAAQAAGADLLKSLVDQQGPRRRFMGNNLIFQGAMRSQVQKDLQEIFRDALLEIAQANLSTEAVDRYQHECDARIKAQKTSGVLSLVAALDDRLYLSETQRSQLQGEFEKGWQDNWQSAVALMANNPDYFPTVPDGLVVSHLNEFQVAVWQGMQKIDFGTNPWMFLGNAFGIDVRSVAEGEEEDEEQKQDVRED